MRPTISQFEQLNYSSLAKVSDLYQNAADVVDDNVNLADLKFDQLQHWFGLAKDAADTKITQEVDHAREVRNIFYRLTNLINDAAVDLHFAGSYIMSRVKDIRAQGFLVSEDATVTHPNSAKAEAAESYTEILEKALINFDTFDEDYATKISAAKEELAAIKNGQPDIILPNGERKDPDDIVKSLQKMSPDERSAFLRKLTPGQIQSLVTADPDAMGNMNGVPFDVRIAANDTNVRIAWENELDHPTKENQARRDQLQRMLGQSADPSGNKIDGDNGQVDRKFVSFNNADGTMIEMVGSLGPGSKGAGVYVPGTSSNLNGSTKNRLAAYNLARQSHAPVFLYMDGKFPPSIPDAVDPKYAANMAPKLVEFGKELDREIATHAPGVKTTFIGHSYGGSIVGTAEQLGLNADRVVYASSAGTGIYAKDGSLLWDKLGDEAKKSLRSPGAGLVELAQYNNRNDIMDWKNPNPHVQRFSMTAPGDLIGISQSFGGNPHGADPDEVAGVRRMDTGYYTGDGDDLNSQDDRGKHKRGEVVFGQDGHGDYWNDPGSTAFQNMVGVVAGTEITEYVEREIHSNSVDVNLGDDGDLKDELYDAAVGKTSPILKDAADAANSKIDDVSSPRIKIPGIDIPGLGVKIDPPLLPPIKVETPEIHVPGVEAGVDLNLPHIPDSRLSHDPYGNPVVIKNIDNGKKVSVD